MLNEGKSLLFRLGLWSIKNRNEAEELARRLSPVEVTAVTLLELHQPAGRWWSQGLTRVTGTAPPPTQGRRTSSRKLQRGCLRLVWNDPTLSLFLAWYQVNLFSCSPCWQISYLGEGRERHQDPWKWLLLADRNPPQSTADAHYPAQVLSSCTPQQRFLTRRQHPVPSRSALGDGGEGDDKGRELFISFFPSWKSKVAVTSERQRVLSSPHSQTRYG